MNSRTEKDYGKAIRKHILKFKSILAKKKKMQMHMKIFVGSSPQEKMKGEAKSDEEAEEKRLHCFAYMDKSGRILVPLRNREEAGIADIAGADVELDLFVRKVYRKKEEDRG